MSIPAGARTKRTTPTTMPVKNDCPPNRKKAGRGFFRSQEGGPVLWGHVVGALENKKKERKKPLKRTRAKNECSSFLLNRPVKAWKRRSWTSPLKSTH